MPLLPVDPFIRWLILDPGRLARRVRSTTPHLVPHPHEVSIEPVPKGDRIHPADADALGAIQPFVTIVCRRECGRDHERRKLRETRAKRAGVTVDAEVEPSAIGEIDAR